jgi:dolichol-phosphate mannosyltransferase
VPDELVVLPTFNEAGNLGEITAAIRNLGYGLVVVDDDSPDGTGRIADQLAAADEGITVVHRPGKLGIGPAYVHGFRVALDAGAVVVFEMDADFSHDPADLARLAAAVHSGADVVLGSRYVEGGGVEGWAAHRRLISRAGNRYARWMLSMSVADATSGFRAYSAAALRRLSPDTCRATGYGFQVEMVWRAVEAGMQVVEVPIVFRERRTGASKMSPRIALEAMGLVTGWGIRRRFGARRRGLDRWS